MKTQQEIAAELRAYLLTKVPTQRELAELIGVSIPHLSNYLRGAERISRKVAARIVELWPEIREAFILTGDGSLLNSGNTIQHLNRVTNTGSIVNGSSRDAEVAMLREQLDREREARSRAEAQVSDLTEIIANLTKK